MVNLLIVEDDIIQSQHLINVISSRIEDIRLYNMSVTGKEAVKIIDNVMIKIFKNILNYTIPSSPKQKLSYLLF